MKRIFLILLFISLIISSCSSSPCKTGSGTRCIKVEDVLKTPVNYSNDDSKMEIGINKTTENSSDKLKFNISGDKPLIITIFKYQDNYGIIHWSSDHIIPPKPPEISINKE